MSATGPKADVARAQSERFITQVRHACGYDKYDQYGQCCLGGVGETCGTGLTSLNLREHGSADERIHQRKNCHNRLKVLLHV
jgi:hypothetical protein